MSSPPSSGYPAPGARIGRFRILEQLGQGGMGVVFRAMEENLGREVALKVIAPLFAHDPEFRERFIREARAQASLESAHVVAVYAHGEEDGYLYIASQLIPGGDLGEMIRTSGVPSMADALDVIEQVASGLADAHDAGLVHRDIKPGNILVRRRPGAIRAYITDFGIARRMNADATRFSSSTAGTPSYMAPELHGGAKATAVTDIYAVGCLLWVALTGSPPYRGTSEYQLIAAHIGQPVPQLAGSSPMANATNRILRTAMAKDPADRYQSAGELSADLQAALRLPATGGAATPAAEGRTALRPLARPTPAPPRTPAAPPTPPQPVHVPPPPAFLSATPAPRRRTTRWWWALLPAAAIVAIGVGAAAALLAHDDDPSGPTVREAFLDQDAKQIVRSSEKDMAVVESARIEGQFVQDGGGAVSVDVTATASGDCEGTMTSQSSGGVAELRSVGEDVYLRADEAYLGETLGAEGAAQVRPVIGDRWIVYNTLRESIEAFCDLDEFLERDGREDAVATNLGTEPIGGSEAVKVEQAEGSESEVLYIRVDEPHHLLRVEESAQDYFEFSDFDEDVEIRAPSSEDVFDLDEFLAGAS